MIDYHVLVEMHRLAREQERERDRLADSIERREGGARHDLAQACYRLAGWLDTDRYAQAA
jgi:hypothetical protein